MVVEVPNVGKSRDRNKGNDEAAGMGCWIKFRLMRICMPSIFSRSKREVFSTNSRTPYAESKSTNDTSTSGLVAAAAKTDSNAGNASSPVTSEQLRVSSQLRKFSFKELKLATRNFRPKSLVGEGGFGCVFKGWINEDGTNPANSDRRLAVAVKILNPNGLQGHKEWLAEVNYLGELIHRNLVKLLGYCIEDDQRLLVYEYMPRGSLENHLFKRSLPLPWSTRMKIALDAARGLAFLHDESKRPVIYRDFKPSNILLDEDYNAKLSDFGLAKDGPEGDKTHVSTQVMGTFGYVAPEYVLTGHLTTKSDVYSFGVVLLEILTGRKAMDKNRPIGERSLVKWAQPQLGNRRRFYRLIDPRLEGQFSIEGAQKALQLAASCLSHDQKARPLMREVVEILNPLPHLKDMASSSSVFQAMQVERFSSSQSAQSSSRMHSGMSSKNRRLLRSLSNGLPASPSPYNLHLARWSPGHDGGLP